MASNIAAAIPPVEAARARRGTPFTLRLPSHSGAYPPLEREKSMRVVRYKSALELESAAVITTRSIMLATEEMHTAEKELTKGPPVMPVPVPACLQGVIAIMMVMART